MSYDTIPNRNRMPLLCREKEYKLLSKLLLSGDINTRVPNPPQVVFVQGGPQTGKKCLVSSVLDNIQSNVRPHKKTAKNIRIRSAFVSCHLGSFSSASIFEELWRQLSSHDMDQSGKCIFMLQ